jgi:two-component system response regulator
VTTDGLEALSFVRKSGNFAHMPRPDFIVLDLDLDKISGHVVLDAIRMDPDMHRLPVVLLGDSPTQWNLSHNQNLKSCRFLPKPLDREALAAEFRSLRALARV